MLFHYFTCGAKLAIIPQDLRKTLESTEEKETCRSFNIWFGWCHPRSPPSAGERQSFSQTVWEQIFNSRLDIAVNCIYLLVILKEIMHPDREDQLPVNSCFPACQESKLVSIQNLFPKHFFNPKKSFCFISFQKSLQLTIGKLSNTAIL